VPGCWNADCSGAALPNPAGIWEAYLNKHFPQKYVQNHSLIRMSFFCSKILLVEDSQAAVDDKTVGTAYTR